MSEPRFKYVGFALIGQSSELKVAKETVRLQTKTIKNLSRMLGRAELTIIRLKQKLHDLSKRKGKPNRERR